MLSFRQNLTLGFFGHVFAKSSIFLYHFSLPHLLGREGYGLFAYLFALGAMLLQPLLELGLAQLVPKWIGRNHPEVISQAFRYQSTATLIWVPVFVAVSVFIGKDWWLTAFLALHFVSNSIQQVSFGVFRGREDLRVESLLLPAQNLLALLWIAAALVQGWNDPWVGAAGLAVSRLAGTLVLLPNLHKLPFKDSPEPPVRFGKLLKEAVSLGAVLVLIQLYFRVDTAMLGWMRGEAEVALYSAAYIILEGTFFIPALVTASLIGSMSRFKEFHNSFRKGLKVLSASGVGIGITVALLAPWGFDTFYPDDFRESGFLLRWLAPVIPFVFWGYLTTQALVALDRNRSFLGITMTGLLLNVLLNWWLIPLSGAKGAAWATLLTEALIPLLCMLVIRSIKNPNRTPSAY